MQLVAFQHCGPLTRRPHAARSRVRRSAVVQSNLFPDREISGAVSTLLSGIQNSERGLTTANSDAIVEAVDELARLGSGTTTTDAKLSGTWRLLWTTEKETLWILKNAGLFGTKAGEVYQVIDVAAGTLQNVITFPPGGGAFIVNSAISIAGAQRTEFKFTSAKLKLPSRDVSLPPFGKGWFDTVYMDADIRVARDVRGDTLVVARDGPPRMFS